jgi:signal transduction histidine kinase
VALPDPDDDQEVTVVSDDGTVEAIIVHRPTSLADPRLRDAAVAATRLTTANARLRHELELQARAVDASRRRLLTAADAERAALERRIHEGPGRLVVDALARISHRDKGNQPSAVVDPGREGPLVHAESGLRDSLHDLDALANGLHPRDLELGLINALSAVAARSPVPVSVEVSATASELLSSELGAEVARTVYFVVAEALTNVAAYSSASQARVLVEALEGNVMVRVIDDGSGGARMTQGGGLMGLADRVDTFAGVLSVTSPAGQGTTVEASLPTGRGPSESLSRPS